MPRNRACPYVCPRCGYNTPNIGKIRAHFEMKGVCPATLKSIVLTNDIKNIVLRDRLYRETSTDSEEYKDIIDESKNREREVAIKTDGLLYIMHIPSINEENIFKIGRTNSVVTRLSNYPDGTILCDCEWVNDQVGAETMLLSLLNKDEHIVAKRDLGKEYFKCDLVRLRQLYKLVVCDFKELPKQKGVVQ